MEEDTRDFSERTDWTSVAAVTLGITAFAMAQGLTYPLLSFLLRDLGVSETTIGLHAASFMVGFVVSVLALPTLNAHVRAGNLIAAGLAVAALSLVGFMMTENLTLWLFFRFVLGFCVNTIYVLGEAWLNAASADKVRGRIAGVYGAGMSLGFAIGPMGIPVFGTEGGLAFAVCASLVGFVSFIFAMLARRAKVEPGRIILREVFSFFRIAPMMVLLVVVFGVFDSTAISILPIYFTSEGLSQNAAAVFVTVLHIGMIAAQPFLGMLLDRSDRWRVVVGCLAATSLCFIAMFYVPPASVMLWPIAALAGAAYFGIYTSAIALLGQVHKGSVLVAGSAAFSLAFALGGIVGPTATGTLLEWNTASAFWLLVVVSAAAGLVVWLQEGRGTESESGPS